MALQGLNSQQTILELPTRRQAEDLFIFLARDLRDQSSWLALPSPNLKARLV
jgi:hypothetical protein